MRFYNFGFYIFKPVPAPAYLDIQCDSLVTVSNCIADVHPNLTGSFWLNREDEQEKYQKELFLDDSEFMSMKENISEMYENHRIDFDSRFLVPEEAAHFKNTFLTKIPELKIVGISIAENLRNVLNEEIEKSNANIKNPEINCRTVQSGGRFLGYDILGWDNNIFHTYLCNSLHEDIGKQREISINQYGLLGNSYSDAADFSKIIAGMGEPVVWLPFAVHEYL